MIPFDKEGYIVDGRMKGFYIKIIFDKEETGGYYVQSSVHSSEPAGGTVSLCLLETLLSENPDILDDVVFYVVPRVNPDGVEGNLLYNTATRSKSVTDERKKENVLIPKDMDGE